VVKAKRGLLKVAAARDGSLLVITSTVSASEFFLGQ